MNLDHLAQLATEATPGPWEAGTGFDRDEIFDDIVDAGPALVVAPWSEATEFGTGREKPGPHPLHDQALADAAFIAAANPSVVLALVEVARAAQKWSQSDSQTEGEALWDISTALAKLDNLGGTE